MTESGKESHDHAQGDLEIVGTQQGVHDDKFLIVNGGTSMLKGGSNCTSTLLLVSGNRCDRGLLE